MQKLSFIKGLLIGAIFSATFWVGAYQVFNTLNQEETPQENIIKPLEEAETEVAAIRASM